MLSARRGCAHFEVHFSCREFVFCLCPVFALATASDSRDDLPCWPCVQSNVEVELWDVSGDRAYEGAWPAIMHGGVGIVYVYDSANVGQEKDLDQW